jgi:hypothetical protein
MFILISIIMIATSGCSPVKSNLEDLREVSDTIKDEFDKQTIPSDTILGVNDRMHYPYIDGASEECRRLTETELQAKRANPEISITCVME